MRSCPCRAVTASAPRASTLLGRSGWSASAPSCSLSTCGELHPRRQWLVYLALYLDRGVRSEKNVLRCNIGRATFRYTDNRSASQTRVLAGADFLWLLLQRVLANGLRRTGDWGFLHAYRKRLLPINSKEPSIS